MCVCERERERERERETATEKERHNIDRPQQTKKRTGIILLTRTDCRQYNQKRKKKGEKKEQQEQQKKSLGNLFFFRGIIEKNEYNHS